MGSTRCGGGASRRGPQAAAALLAVAAMVLAHPPLRVPGLGLVMIAPLAFALDGMRTRCAFVLAWLTTGAAALWLVRWLLHALVEEYGVAHAPAWMFAVIIVFGLALVQGAAGAIFSALASRSSTRAAPLAFAAIWTLGEWLRGAGLGVPWLLTGHALARWPAALQVAELFGQYAVSFGALAVGAGLGIALRRRSAQALLAPALVAVLWLGYGTLRLATFSPTHGPVATIGVVQASVPQSERFQDDSALRNLARYAEATRALAARVPLDLVVWSETAVDADIGRSPDLRARLAQLATEIGVPILTGAPRSRGGMLRNAAVLFAPGQGLVESYDKQRLVPFSEYSPVLGDWLAPLVAPVVRGAPYVPGSVATVFRAAPIPLATPVCFEITDPELVRRFRASGARLLVNLSNDAWFGPVGYPELHFEHAILRAVETRSPVVRGANTGISGVIDATGRVRESIPAFTEGTLHAEVAAAGAVPLYARTGDAPFITALLLALAAMARRPPATEHARASRRWGSHLEWRHGGAHLGSEHRASPPKVDQTRIHDVYDASLTERSVQFGEVKQHFAIVETSNASLRVDESLETCRRTGSVGGHSFGCHGSSHGGRSGDTSSRFRLISLLRRVAEFSHCFG